MAKILVVDDEKIISRSIQRVLTKVGHIVTVANNGLEAIQHLETASTQPFDLIFMDLLMPELSGSEVLDVAHQKTPSTKVLMMTAYGDLGAREDLLKRGATMVLSKPFDDMTKLPVLVSTILGQ